MLNASNTNRKMKNVVLTAMIARRKSQSEQSRFNLNDNLPGFLSSNYLLLMLQLRLEKQTIGQQPTTLCIN
jgi:hypothetical protein